MAFPTKHDEADRLLDPLAEDIAGVIGNFIHRTAALRLLLKKVQRRLACNDRELRKFLDDHPHGLGK